MVCVAHLEPVEEIGKRMMGMTSYCSPLSISTQRSQKENRWGSFVASYIVQATAVTALVFYTVTAPAIMPTQAEHVELVVPELVAAPKVSQVEVKLRPVTKMAQAAIVQPKIALPKIMAPVLQVQMPQRVHQNAEVAEVAQPQLSVAAPKFDSKILKVLNALPGPKAASKIVATNTFGGSSATPTLQKLVPGRVQTGGFGDPNGVPANAHGSNRSTIAAAGSFDLPSGGGHGNGSGGISGVRGTIVSAGFGNGVAVQGSGGRGGSAGQGHIQSTSFVTTQAAPDETRRNKALSHQALSAPVSIQSKPTPVYTPEARQLRVEGEVLLNVVFTANGQIHILNMVRGLGHGLDEAAQRAAQGVRFSPAMRDGHPVDSNVTLHIVFQLS
jgi:TonB family protein